MSAPTQPTLDSLSFGELRTINVKRCVAVFFGLDRWTPLEWAGAVAGEVGEAANLTKKMRRGETVDPVAIGAEIADAVMYLDLLAANLGLDLGAMVRRKFNIVSERRSSPIRLPDMPAVEPLDASPEWCDVPAYRVPGCMIRDGDRFWQADTGPWITAQPTGDHLAHDSLRWCKRADHPSRKGK